MTAQRRLSKPYVDKTAQLETLLACKGKRASISESFFVRRPSVTAVDKAVDNDMAQKPGHEVDVWRYER
jgi:hypothetical protein